MKRDTNSGILKFVELLVIEFVMKLIECPHTRQCFAIGKGNVGLHECGETHPCVTCTLIFLQQKKTAG